MTRYTKLDEILSSDPKYHYSDDELDAIEEIDPALALRLARVQHFAQLAAGSFPKTAGPIEPNLVDQAIDRIRQILSMDGGDIELVGVENNCVIVRMKGACVGCPNAVLDLKNVVEKIMFETVPGVIEVKNTF